MTTRLTVVDAFTDRLFTGNPAAVCLLEAPASAEWMQSVASEMNLSETAFCVARPDSPGGYELRWFTPVAEVNLCGHATLATTHILGSTARFATRSGELVGSVDDDGWIALDFPADAPKPVGAPEGLDAVLGGASAVAVAAGRDNWLVELADEAAVRTLRPDLPALLAIGRRGLIATAAASGDVDVVSRCFFPAHGIPEDPVTGSAHCTIARYWAERLGDQLVCEQASARGGIVRTRLAGDRVELRGRAVSVSEVVLHSDPG